MSRLADASPDQVHAHSLRSLAAYRPTGDVIRPAALVYAEGVCAGLELALSCLQSRKQVWPFLRMWRDKLELERARTQA